MKRTSEPTKQRFQIAYLHPYLDAFDSTTAKMSSANQQHEATLDKMWKAVIALKPTSSDADFEAAVAFFTPEAKAYINGMIAPPAEGRAAIVATFKQLVQFWAMDVHRVGKVAYSADGKTVMREMKNRLLIAGEPVEDFIETESADFDDEGLIKEYRLHTDSSPVMAVLIKKGFVPAPKYD
jgi:hypothetical protein